MHAVHLVLILALLFIALGAANVQSYEGRTNPLLDPRVAPLQTLVTEQDSRSRRWRCKPPRAGRATLTCRWWRRGAGLHYGAAGVDRYRDAGGAAVRTTIPAPAACGTSGFSQGQLTTGNASHSADVRGGWSAALVPPRELGRVSPRTLPARTWQLGRRVRDG